MPTAYIAKPSSLPTNTPVGDQNVPALCVDLDHTLVNTNTFIESLLLFIKQMPRLIFLLPIWALKGKAYLRQQIANRVRFDASNLPYREDILSFLHQEFQKGRTIILVTDADQKLAQDIADHLNIFSAILASDGNNLCSGSHKKHLLESKLGQRPWNFLGCKMESDPDYSYVSHALPSPQISTHRPDTHASFHPTLKSHNTISNIIKALRVHQWIKNILIFLPLAGAQLTLDFLQVFTLGIAFLSFSLCASGLYIFNDLLDLPADRRHPKKRHRPFASGALPLKAGLLAHPLLLISGFALASWCLPSGFVSILGFYCFMTVSYSIYLKKLMMIDVITLAGFYTLRVFAGGLAVGGPVSAWLLAFCLFFFLSLAFSKRHGELQFRKVSTHQGVERRAYIGGDKEMLATMGTISGYMSVLILALYINSQEVASRYQTPEFLWFACPLLLYWVSRTWMLAHRGTLEDDPLVVAFRDPRSYIIGFMMGALGYLAI